jgi:cation diffusion facilitator family transporter
MNQKVKVASLSIFSNTFLIVLKIIAGILTGSVSIISEAIHSGMDLIASFVAYFSVRISDKPSDEDHPWGHGKYENISGVIEAILIFVAAIWILYESTLKIIDSQPVESISYGFIVMFISCLVNIFVSRRLYKIAKKTDSVALEADALHLKTDVYTSFGVGVGLLLIWLTGLTWLDPIVAILVAVFILFESYKMFKKSYQPLLDTTLPKKDLKIIKQKIEIFIKIEDYHNLRTRKSGSIKFVDFHITVDKDMTVNDSHNLCDDIEDEIRKVFKNIEISIHIEPKN